MKPATAAKKLGIYLPAAPPEFQEGEVSREQLDELQSNPPEWLAELRRNGPHPRPVVAQKLNVTISGLARAGVTEALTTQEISDLLQNRPQWLVDERANMAAVRDEQKRIRDAAAEKSTKTKGQSRHFH
jgi:type II secretory pathway component HofQ